MEERAGGVGPAAGNHGGVVPVTPDRLLTSSAKRRSARPWCYLIRYWVHSLGMATALRASAVRKTSREFAYPPQAC
jgi:hypothetical protein